jgi:hypothetical protein
MGELPATILGRTGLGHTQALSERYTREPGKKERLGAYGR